MVIFFRPEMMPELTWLVPGGEIRVERGLGEHEGMLRITPGRQRRLSAHGGGRPDGSGGRRTAMPALRLPAPMNIDLVKRSRFPVEYDYDADWLELTLPSWARSSEPIPLFTKPEPKQPFRMLGSDGIDPMVAKRGKP
jgi:hypothetical protein